MIEHILLGALVAASVWFLWVVVQWGRAQDRMDKAYDAWAGQVLEKHRLPPPRIDCIATGARDAWDVGSAHPAHEGGSDVQEPEILTRRR